MQRNEILRSYGTDYKGMTKELLYAADVAADIRAKCIAAIDAAICEQTEGRTQTAAKTETATGAKANAHYPAAHATHQESADSDTSLELSHSLHIGIKPNLVCPTPAEMGGTTHPEVVAGIIEYLLEAGFEPSELEILEGSWVGDRTSEAFEYCGYNALSRKYGVCLIDMQQEREYEARDCAGLKLNICARALHLDYLINVPVLKGHCQTKITCALKNMKGLIPDAEKRRFHRLGLHEPIAKLNTVLKPDLIVVDHICGDPDFEEGGNPLVRNCVMLAKDPVLVDTFTAKVLGYVPSDVEYITLAESLGVGSTDIENALIRTISGNATEGEQLETRKVIETAYAVSEIDSCSACYGSLIPALDRLKAEGLFDRLTEKLDGEKLAIGQGYKGRSGHYGVGNCTAGFEHCIKGCPPEAEHIYMELRRML